jgi:DNA-binding XRE family transcriptional regulator
MKIENLKDWRYLCDITQTELARRVGLTKMRVSEIEGGDLTKEKTAQKTACALSIELEDLATDPLAEVRERLHATA